MGVAGSRIEVVPWTGRLLDRREAGRVLAEATPAVRGCAQGWSSWGCLARRDSGRVPRWPGPRSPARRVRGAQARCAGQEELAMGAIASGGIVVINQEVVEALKSPGAGRGGNRSASGWSSARREAFFARGSRPARGLRPNGDPGRRRPGHRVDHARRRAGFAAKEPGRDIVVASPPPLHTICAEFQTVADECVCRRSRRSRSGRSDSGIRTSNRPATRRSATPLAIG